jgi:CO dehydrogenase maturation factor
MLDEAGLELAGTVPADEGVYEHDRKGEPTVSLPEANPAVAAAFYVFDRVFA